MPAPLNSGRVEAEATAPRPSFGLSRLIFPIDVKTFEKDFWEKKPLIIRRDSPDYYSDVLSLRDVDGILDSSSLRESDVRLVKAGRETAMSELVTDDSDGRATALEGLYERYRDGATVNLMFLHERWPPLGRLCRKLAAKLSCGVHGNVYLTPAGSQGLDPHYDTHDVFVMQLHGSKHWRLYEGRTPLPLQSQGYRPPPEGAGEPVMEFDLHAGDLAYLPRGTVHAATANEATSMHLTIGMVPVVWGAVLRDVLDAAMRRDVALREALPLGFARDDHLQQHVEERLAELFAGLGDSISWKEAVTDVSRRALRRRQVALTGHLTDLEAIGSLDVVTSVRRRQELLWRQGRDSGQVFVEFHGKVLGFPGALEEELEFIAKADAPFRGADLPGGLDDAGRLVLVGRLLREGFLTMA
ncbi:MAG: cupin [Streptosporangiaceae bacterium]|jgi:ribosomal protein L16 Arg81 hydroxylase|nr:cupin [Streptosporangiaceae bacterium]